MLRSRFDSWIHDTFRVSPEGLGAYRIFYAAFALFVIAPGNDAYASLSGFASLPSSMYTPPPGPMQFFGGFPAPITVECIHILLNVGLVALLVGYRTRWSSFITGALYLVLFGFSYSLGKINHNILFVIVPIVMGYSGWGSAYSLDALAGRARGGAAAWPLTLLGLLLGFAMFTAGFAKLLGGWLDPDTHAAFGHVMKNVYVRGRDALLARHVVRMDSGFLWEVFDYLTVIFETGFLIACLKRQWLRLFAGAAVLFHFGIMTSMNIAFAFNLAVYAAFVDWHKVVAWVKGVFADRQRFRRVHDTQTGRQRFAVAFTGYLERHRHLMRLVVPAVILLVGSLFYAGGSPLLWLDRLFVLDSDLRAREVLVVATGTALVLWFGIRYTVPVLQTAVIAAVSRWRGHATN